MDKYQKYLMEENEFTFIGGSDEDRNVWNNETFVFNQDSDIMLKGYCLNIDNKTIQSVYAITGSNESLLCSEDFDTLQSKLVIPIDFDDKIDKIRIVFKNNLADDLIVPFVYNDADKAEYYARKEQERKDDLIKIVNVTVATGDSLVNIYFQSCSEEYAKTDIVLYKDNMMLAKYNVDEGMFFKSINGLAYGKYSFILRQYDNSCNVLVEVNKEFVICKPIPKHLEIGHLNVI